MMRVQDSPYGPVRSSRFPPVLFGIILGGLLLTSGIHYGLLLLVNELKLNAIIQTMVPLFYWIGMSVTVTLVIVHLTKRTYERPMKQIAEAARRVASGDFSVYVPPIHTANKLDYLDVMILDFNKMVEELGSIETLKNDFAANVSHELKTPLAAIQNDTQLLQMTGLTPAQQEHISAILSSTGRLAALITNILKLNKLESQKIQPKPKPYDLCRQLSDCVIGFETIWETKQIEIEVDMEDRAVITADESLMEIVWNNLLSNAFKFTESGGTVSLVQTSDPEQITVTVSDTGCGMSPTTKKHIFDKFYQGDTSHATEGNGLGLALVRRILQISGGTIAVESEEGRGTTFTVRFPHPAFGKEHKTE
ncbi:MAG: ATP-binding protein [Butyricicoccus sp.]